MKKLIISLCSLVLFAVSVTSFGIANAANAGFQIGDKSGNSLYGPAEINTLALVSPGTLLANDSTTPSRCDLLDNTNIRGIMSPMFETNLLKECGRQNELGGVPAKVSPVPVVPSPEGAAISVVPDVLVNNPSLDVGGVSHTQSETTIAINPNTGTICSAYNDSYSYFTQGIGLSGFSRSIDGGASFVDNGAFPGGSGGISYGDPTLVWKKADGYFYFGSICGSGLCLWRSSDDCNSFTQYSVIHSGGGDDKELMAVDNNVSSPYYGRFYVAWTNFGAGGLINVTYSQDGSTWSTPVAVSDAGVTVQGAWPTVAPNGDVYVAWVRWNPWPNGPIDIEVARSTDGGVSFSKVTNPLTGGVNPQDATATANCFRPALNGNIRYLPSPQIAVAPDGTLHVVYSYDPDGYNTGDASDVFYRRSTDNGTTWGSEMRLNDDGTLTDQWFPTVSVGPSNTVVATWYDRRNDTANNNLFDYYKRFSYDGGLTWQPSIRVSDVSSPVYLDPYLARCYHGDYDTQVQDSSYVYIQWSSDRNIQDGHNDPDVWFEKEPILPDLMVSLISVSPTGVVGGTMTVSYIGCNQGAVSVNTNYFDGLYLSEDTIITSGDYQLLTLSYPGMSLPPGACHSFLNYTLTIRSDIRPRIYYIGAITDLYNQVPEIKEDNNTLAGNTINIQALLTVTKSGTGTGTVTSNPAGINCGSICSAAYDGNTSVTLTAIPATGSVFVGWSGDADCSDGSVTMNANKTCTATFKGLPDLLPTAISAVKSGGNRVLVSDTVKNQGIISAGSFTIKYYLSTNTTYEPGTDIALVSSSNGTGTCSRTVSSLPPGGSNSISSKTCYKPRGAVSGVNYYVIVVDDTGNTVIESDETNNTGATSGTIQW